MRILTTLALATLISACTGPHDTPTANENSQTADPSLASFSNPERMVLFGDTHVHTMNSFDAYSFGTRATPDDAYRYAKGDALTHPGGFKMKLDRPLDFLAVTDHGVYLGIVPAMADPNSNLGQHRLSKQLQAASSRDERIQTFYDIIKQLQSEPDELQDLEIFQAAWQSTIDAAERHNRPGEFTTFIAYEFSPAPESQNLHRNIIFRNSRAPKQPFSALDSLNPEDLWDWMDDLRSKGIDSLAISHNSNASNGQMFKLVDWAGDPLTDEYASQRMRNEPLIEITQVKGTSETHPSLSPTDEWAGFEIQPTRVSSTLPSNPPGSYARDALRKGLGFTGLNLTSPFRFGFIGSSDTHVGAGGYSESDYWSKIGLVDATPQSRGSVSIGNNENGEPEYQSSTFKNWGASGLAGVWAESNTREAIFSAIRRKETFATSGPRIRMRFFASQQFPENLLSDAKLITTAYAKGVAMGGELIAKSDVAPQFIAWALQDTYSAPLQRLQIIKGWLDKDGSTHEQVIDVACADGLLPDPLTQRCPDNGARVNLSDCSVRQRKGAPELKVLWSDPNFDPNQEAFYYLRALENPTCRWSTWDAIRAGVTPRPDLPPTLQERAWSSPIWIRHIGSEAAAINAVHTSK